MTRRYSRRDIVIELARRRARKPVQKWVMPTAYQDVMAYYNRNFKDTKQREQIKMTFLRLHGRTSGQGDIIAEHINYLRERREQRV